MAGAKSGFSCIASGVNPARPLSLKHAKVANQLWRVGGSVSGCRAILATNCGPYVSEGIDELPQYIPRCSGESRSGLPEIMLLAQRERGADVARVLGVTETTYNRWWSEGKRATGITERRACPILSLVPRSGAGHIHLTTRLRLPTSSLLLWLSPDQRLPLGTCRELRDQTCKAVRQMTRAESRRQAPVACST